MNEENGKIKKTSRGMRKHVRRMKQESRKTGVPVNELKKKGACATSIQNQERGFTIQAVLRKTLNKKSL
jgi:hypothetical protein